jgi:hypothetical protein
MHPPLNPAHKEVNTIFWMPLIDIGVGSKWNTETQKLSKGNIKWLLHTEQPLYIRTAFQRIGIVVNPGDSVCINFTQNGLDFSGKGAEGLKLQYEIEEVQKGIVKPGQLYVFINSPSDYLKWNEYFNNKIQSALLILDRFRDKITPFLHDHIKASIIYNAELDRAEAFMALNSYRIKNASPTFNIRNLSAICDSTLDSYWAKWLRSRSDSSLGTWYFYQYNRIQIWKRFGFNLSNDNINTDSKRRIMYYNSLKENYSGLLRERLLQYVVADETIKEIGFNNYITDSILKDYYSQPGFPEYKEWMKKYEDSMRRKQSVAKNN